MRRYLVTGFCRLTGLWRDYVLAPSASEAIRIYCAEYGMEPGMCAVQEAETLKPEGLSRVCETAEGKFQLRRAA
jgi:hypothetical protein